MTEKFNEGQKTQLKMAQDFCPESVPLLKSHPEWGSSLMNFVFNRIKENRDFEKIIEFARYCPEETDEPGCIGHGDYLYQYAMAEEIGAQDFATEILKKNPGINTNTLFYRILLARGGISDSPFEIRRLPLDETIKENHSFHKCLLSAGDDEVYAILEKIMEQAVFSDFFMDKDDDIEKSPFEYAQKTLNALEDMNMRGLAIRFGYEYCDRYTPEFVSRIMTRDYGMIDFVNASMLVHGISHGMLCVPKAVTRNAARCTEKFPVALTIFTRSKDDVMKYGNFSPHIHIDFKDREIFSGTDTDSALEIIKSLGFIEAFDRTMTKSNGYCESDDMRCIIYIHPSGAVFSAPFAMKENITYGGCEILAVSDTSRDFLDSRMRFRIEANHVGKNKNLSKSRISYHEGKMIHDIKYILDNCDMHAKITDVGYGFQAIPLPSMFSCQYMFRISNHVIKSQSPLLAFISRDNVAFSMNLVLNGMLMPYYITQVTKSTQYIWLPFLQDLYKNILEYCYFTNEPAGISILFGSLFELFQIPDKTRENMWLAAQNKINANKLVSASIGDCIDEIHGYFIGKHQAVKEFMNEFQSDFEIVKDRVLSLDSDVFRNL